MDKEKQLAADAAVNTFENSIQIPLDELISKIHCLGIKPDEVEELHIPDYGARVKDELEDLINLVGP